MEIKLSNTSEIEFKSKLQSLQGAVCDEFSLSDDYKLSLRFKPKNISKEIVIRLIWAVWCFWDAERVRAASIGSDSIDEMDSPEDVKEILKAEQLKDYEEIIVTKHNVLGQKVISCDFSPTGELLLGFENGIHFDIFPICSQDFEHWEITFTDGAAVSVGPNSRLV
jgi:hypothetical protein